jgi:tetratricopeptide (TPR) repeat protein/tRNA A-37 threonylcarbamoyl transferase component Bud32
MYSEVRRMLDEHVREGFLDRRPWAPSASAPPVFAAGQIVSGRYRIIRFLSRGGMGEVYEAEDLELKERVALKTLLPEIAADGRMINRFKQEIQLSRKISHRNVCRVFDLARHPADSSSLEIVFFLTMEFLAGETLADKLEREGRLSPDAALPLLEQMAEALDAAHRAGVIHRDFKPSNVMLVPCPEGLRAVVTDFGLARSFVPTGDTTATQTGTLMGTLDYMAPELLSGGAASISSDIYALGTVAYQMVTGSLPFASGTPLAGAILRSKAAAPSPRSLAPDLDAAWEQAILRALEADPTRRFSRASDFLKAIHGEARSVTVALPAMTRRGVVVAALAAVAIAAGGIAWRAWTHSRNQPSPDAAIFYHQGVDDIHAGAYFAATKALDQAVRIAPRYSLAHARLAEAWVELDVPEKAGREMLLARREDNSGLPDLDRLQIEAVDLTVTREFAAAAGKYEQMRRLTSQEAGLDLDLGRAYEEALQPPKAMESYRRAAEGPSHSPAAWLHLAILYFRASDRAKAEDAFNQAEELYQLSSNLEGLTEVEDQRGIAANSRGQLGEAEVHLRKALETARLAGNIQQELRAKLQLSTNAYISGDNVLAERYSQEALDAAQANQMEGLVIRGVVGLGNAYRRKGDSAGAEKYYREALALARHSSSPHLAAFALSSLASLHDQLKRSEDSVREATEALAFYQPNGYAKESLQCLTMIGRAQRYRGDYIAALDSFQRLLDMAEKIQDRSQMGLAHESVGGVLLAQERYPEALEQYRKSLELSTDTEHIGYAGLGCGQTLRLLGRFPEARAALDRVGPIAEGFPSIRLYLMQYRAEMALSQGLHAEAAAISRRTLASGAGRDPLTVADLKGILGLALLASGDRTEGLRNCEESLAAAAKLNDVAVLLRSRLALLQAWLETGDRAAALGIFHDAEPALAGHPESRWRALALLARADRKYAIPARQALDELARRWGDAAYRTYLTRPDVQKLSRPLLQSISANR